jgi:hypothetical protein
LECATFSEQLNSVGEVMQWTLWCDMGTLSNARVSADASGSTAYAFLESVKKLMCLYRLKFPMSERVPPRHLFQLAYGPTGLRA